MITVYAFTTPNSVKFPIALEELGLDYVAVPVHLRKGEQKRDEFKALNPNAKVPVLIDSDGPHGQPITLSESAAILVYLAEKSGRLLPRDGAERAKVFEQLFFHAAGVGAAFGNAFSQRLSAPESDAATRAIAEAQRTVGVLDEYLKRHPFVAGNELTIADIAHFGWLWRQGAAGVSLESAPNVQAWMQRLSDRPAFQRGIERTVALSA